MDTNYITVNVDGELELHGDNSVLTLIYNHWNNLKKVVHVSGDSDNDYIRKLEKKISDLRVENDQQIDNEVLRYRQRIDALEQKIIDVQDVKQNEITECKKHYEQYIDKLNELLIFKKDLEPKEPKRTDLVSVGQSYEDEICGVLIQHYNSGYDIIHDTTKHCGDIIIVNKTSNVRVCIEVKNYTHTIPQKEHQKFISDVCNKDNAFSAGIFISKSLGLANTGFVQWHHGKPCFYITENNIPFLISSINFLFTILTNKPTEDSVVVYKRKIKEYVNTLNIHKRLLDKMGKSIKSLTKEYTEMQENILVKC